MPFTNVSGLGLVPPEINKMLRHVQRYHFSSLQDKNPVVAFLHNAYAVGIMDMLRDLADDEQIDRATGMDIKKLRKEILDFQDKLESQALKAIHAIGIDKALKMVMR